MAASDPQGQMRFWRNGFPFGGILRSAYDAGQMRFWANGFPLGFIGPPAATTTVRLLALTGVGQ